MAVTYQPIATSTITAGTASQTITFSSIPATYTDLRIVISGVTNAQGKVLYARFNGDTGTNYYTCELYAQSTGSNTSSSLTASSNGIKLNSTGTALTPMPFLCLVDVMNYASSSYNKTVLANSYDIDGTSRLLVIQVLGFQIAQLQASLLLHLQELLTKL